MAVNLKIVSQVVTSGTPGPAGKSAYQIAVDNGFQGTESEWLKELHPFKGWFDSVSELEEEHSAPSVGEYAYVKGATSSDPVKIYECSTEGSWSDSGRTVDTSTVQTFRSGEAVNDVAITDDSSDIEENSDKIPTAGAVYEHIKEINLKCTDNTNSDFDISDEDGYVLARFKDGHFQTKNFNSGKIGTEIEDNTNSDLDITDINGNVLARFSNGHFQTKNFNSRNIEKNSIKYIEFLAKVSACKYSGKLMHISFDDTSDCLTTLFSNTYTSIYDVTFFNNLKTLHETYGACFSCYVYVESLVNVNDDYAVEFQNAKSWLKWNFHTLNNKQYTESIKIDNDYILGISRLLTMCGGDEECLDHQMRANYWELSLSNAEFVRDYEQHQSFIFCAKDAFSPSTGNYYLNDYQKNFIFNNGLLYDVVNQIIFIQTCARLDSDDYINRSKTLIQSNIKWQKNCEVLNHQWAFNFTKMNEFLNWAKTTMNFQFGFFDNIFKIL